MNESIAMVFVEQPLASPRFDNHKGEEGEGEPGQQSGPEERRSLG